ncbi:uncharacterized protein LOC129740390 [Uranotaenia lowii]|uniref:uncharacterized protein LOC129740390 n=1 Tax=Uranotaenia lowii TaxID=190385 RepID=UPI00247929CF|nr:uncharacterized protein LOC129740390 [Uranotaenia lowii]XP_055588024.1 uncharacterized protein LOC129740390 [Uranotaenia lowii]
MPEPTKDELRAEIAVILKDANLEETAAKKVRLQLEANLKCDLSGRKKEVDDLVMDYVNAQDESEQEEEDEEEDEEEEEEEEKPKKNAKNSSKKRAADSEDEDDYSEEEAPKKKVKRGAPAKKKSRGSDSEEESEGSEESDDDYKPNKGAKGSAKKGGRKKKGGSESDSDEDWKRSKAAKPKGKPGPKKGGKGTGYTRPYKLSTDLAAICGAEELPRHEVVKKVWAIIKERNLYDPKNKQYAICDSELQKVIGVKRFRTFGMLKYLKPHFLN